MKHKGQITIGIGIISSFLLAGIAGWFTQATATDNKIEKVRSDVVTQNVETVQRISKLEEAVATIKGDVHDIKASQIEILTAVRK